MAIPRVRECPVCRTRSRFYSADVVCFECREKILKYDKLEEALHQVEQWRTARLGLAYEARDGDVIQKVFAPLLEVLPRDESGRPMLPEYLCEPFRETVKRVQQFGEYARAEGFERGSSILARLNEGGVSLEDFEHRRSINAKELKRRHLEFFDK